MKRHKLLRPVERVPELPTKLWRVRPVRGAIVYTDADEPLPDTWLWVPVSPHLVQAIKRGDLERDGAKTVKRVADGIVETVLQAPSSGNEEKTVQPPSSGNEEEQPPSSGSEEEGSEETIVQAPSSGGEEEIVQAPSSDSEEEGSEETIVQPPSSGSEEEIVQPPSSGSEQSATAATTATTATTASTVPSSPDQPKPVVEAAIRDERNAGAPKAAELVTSSGEFDAPPPYAHTPGTRRTPEQIKAMLAVVDAAPKGHKKEMYDNLYRICGFPSAHAMKTFSLRERKKLREG